MCLKLCTKQPVSFFSKSPSLSCFFVYFCYFYVFGEERYNIGQSLATKYREWALFMVQFILWSSFVMSLSAGILLIYFEKPATKGIRVYFIAFAIGNGLYACWVTM